MPYDRGGVPRVAWPRWIIGWIAAAPLILPACVPAAVPTPPGPGDGTPAGGGVIVHALKTKVTNGRQVVIGEMCPLGAAGRPGLAPIAMRDVQWSDAAGEIQSVIERGSVPQFAVYGVDGKVAGAFETLGLADIAPGQTIVSGGYAGASPCTYDVTPAIPDAPNVRAPAAGSGEIDGRGLPPAGSAAEGRRGQIDGRGLPPAGSAAEGRRGEIDAAGKKGAAPIATRAEDPRCVPATNGCGLAVGEIIRPDDPATLPVYATGGACIAGDMLAVDIDGDGVAEAFPLAGVLDGIRGPATEWTAAPVQGAPCTPSFQLFDVHLADGEAKDPRAAVTMDVLGVIDVDGDGRRELVLALKFPTVRSIVIYTPSVSAQRLDLAGEAQSFAR